MALHYPPPVKKIGLSTCYGVGDAARGGGMAAWAIPTIGGVGRTAGGGVGVFGDSEAVIGRTTTAVGAAGGGAATPSDEMRGVGSGGRGVGGGGVAVAGVTAGLGDGACRVAVAEAWAGRGAASARAGAAGAAGRVAVGTTIVTSPRTTASMVLSGVGWGRAVGNDGARARPQPATRISARAMMSGEKPTHEQFGRGLSPIARCPPRSERGSLPTRRLRRGTRWNSKSLAGLE